MSRLLACLIACCIAIAAASARAADGDDCSPSIYDMAVPWSTLGQFGSVSTVFCKELLSLKPNGNSAAPVVFDLWSAAGVNPGLPAHSLPDAITVYAAYRAGCDAGTIEFTTSMVQGGPEGGVSSPNPQIVLTPTGSKGFKIYPHQDPVFRYLIGRWGTSVPTPGGVAVANCSAGFTIVAVGEVNPWR